MNLCRNMLWKWSSSGNDSESSGESHLHVYRPCIDRFQKRKNNEFLHRFRISKPLVNALASYFGNLLKTRTTKNHAITPEQQLLITLEFYAFGSIQRSTCDTAGLHKSSVCHNLHRLRTAIAGLRSEWVSMPNSMDATTTEASKFYAIFAFYIVIGAWQFFTSVTNRETLCHCHVSMMKMLLKLIKSNKLHTHRLLATTMNIIGTY